MGRARFLGVYCGRGPKTVAHISYKNLRYTFDKSAEKIDGRVLLPMLKNYVVALLRNADS